MEARQLFEVAGAELLEAASREWGQADADHPLVLAIGLTTDESGGFCSIDESDRAVVAKEQGVGDLSDGRSALVAVAADREQELVLHGCEPDGDGLFLAPAEEPPEADAELEEQFVVGVGRV